MHVIPTTILTGFLGSGKTTLLKRLLNDNHGLKIAVIENEFGEENIDHDILLTDVKEQIVQLSNGCICCTIRDDLREALQLLATKKRNGLLDFERVVIETTGLADPGPVAQTFYRDDAVSRYFKLDSIVTLVDAAHARRQLDDRQEARRQVGFADRIFISKTDLVVKREVDLLSRRLKQMNPRAAQKLVHFGNVPFDDILDLHGFDLDAKLDIDPAFIDQDDLHHDHDHDHDHCHDNADCDHGHRHNDDVKSFIFRSGRPFDPGKLESFLCSAAKIYGPCLLRYKGILSIQATERKVILQGVHELMGSDFGPRWADGEERGSKLIFIGIDLPKERFISELEQCLI